MVLLIIVALLTIPFAYGAEGPPPGFRHDAAQTPTIREQDEPVNEHFTPGEPLAAEPTDDEDPHCSFFILLEQAMSDSRCLIL